MPVNFKSQFELAVETPLGKDAIQESDEQTLVELVVNASTIDGLSHQGFQSRPGDLVWGNILTTLCA